MIMENLYLANADISLISDFWYDTYSKKCIMYDDLSISNHYKIYKQEYNPARDRWKNIECVI